MKISRQAAMYGGLLLAAAGVVVMYKAPGWWAVHQAKKEIAAELIDPGSAQFRNIRVVDGVVTKVVCGEVNGKNRLGAYVGFARFYHYKYGSAIDPGQNAGELSQIMWQDYFRYCKKT